jgi:hypothetical protein
MKAKVTTLPSTWRWTPQILDLSTRRRHMVTFTPLLPVPLLMLGVKLGGHRAILDMMVQRKFIHDVFKNFLKFLYKSAVHWSHYVLFEGPCNLTVSYASHFVPGISNVSFRFYNRFCDRKCCCLVTLSMETEKEIPFQSRENSCRNPHVVWTLQLWSLESNGNLRIVQMF